MSFDPIKSTPIISVINMYAQHVTGGTMNRICASNIFHELHIILLCYGDIFGSVANAYILKWNKITHLIPICNNLLENQLSRRSWSAYYGNFT